jgi:DNA-binding NarL/FixJ family response regulator
VPSRRFVTFLINRNPPFQVIGEAMDGLEAVDKVQELGPDVVLMDIALPKLDGLEAARRIKAQGSAPRVIFLSSNSDAEMVEEAFALGACGFIAKNRAASHLTAALEAAFHRCASVSGCLVQIVDEENARKAVLALAAASLYAHSRWSLGRLMQTAHRSPCSAS